MCKLKVLFLCLIFCEPVLSYCQTTGARSVGITLPSLAMLDVEPSTPVAMEFVVPNIAGGKITAPVTNTSKWLNYSSALVQGGARRTVSVSVNKIIAGVDIRLKAAPAMGQGKGDLGATQGEIILGTVPQVLISGIGGAFTGNGVNNGHQISISISTSSYSSLIASNNSLLITYTISD